MPRSTTETADVGDWPDVRGLQPGIPSDGITAASLTVELRKAPMWTRLSTYDRPRIASLVQALARSGHFLQAAAIRAVAAADAWQQPKAAVQLALDDLHARGWIRKTGDRFHECAATAARRFP